MHSPITVPSRTFNAANSVAFSPQGQARVAFGPQGQGLSGGDCTLKLWNLDTGEAIRTEIREEVASPP